MALINISSSAVAEESRNDTIARAHAAEAIDQRFGAEQICLITSS
jgi:hypothetical protein